MIETIQTNDGIDEQGSDMKGSQLQDKDDNANINRHHSNQTK